MQSLVHMRVHVRVAEAFFQGSCVLSIGLGLLGALQALPAVAVLTSALLRIVAPLLEFSLMVLVIVPLAAVAIYNVALTDERLTVPSHLSAYMLKTILTGMSTHSEL